MRILCCALSAPPTRRVGVFHRRHYGVAPYEGAPPDGMPFPGLKPWAEIGVGTKESFAPPSEPDWQFSCIRLSSWWLTFKKIGVPQRALVLRRTSRLRRRRYLATGIDRFLWPGLFVCFGV